jgi:glycosyltransferase involved in cell wall biosynthesis
VATVTTVIPTYQRPALLRRAILSVLAQSYGDLEVHVFDDASSDETEQVVRELARRDTRVKYFCQHKNTGMGINRAQAGNSPRSPFFTVLDDDDLLAPDFFRTALAAFARYPDAMMFCGQLIYYEEALPGRTAPYATLPAGYYPAPTALCQSLANFCSGTDSMMFRREVLDTTGGFDPVADWAADLDFGVRVLARHASIFSDVPCAVHWFHERSSGYAGYLRRWISSGRRVLAKAKCGDGYPADVHGEAFKQLKNRYAIAMFRDAITAATKDEQDATLEAASFLRRDLNYRMRAAAIRMIASGSLFGVVSRAGLKSLRVARRARVRQARNKRSQHYRSFVVNLINWLDRIAAAWANPSATSESSVQSDSCIAETTS